MQINTISVRTLNVKSLGVSEWINAGKRWREWLDYIASI